MMSRFTGDIKLKRSPYKDREMIVDGEITYRHDEYIITVKPGLPTDGASIPRWAWRVIGGPFSGLYLGPALIHDALYAAEAMDRKKQDEIFLHAMKHVGVSGWKANVMYRAVRIGGGATYKAHTPESIAHARECLKVVKV
jgi:hypothetical protein